MELTPGEVYEKLVIRAVLMNDPNLWDEANTFACVHSFNAQEITEYHMHVERWLRLHGITKMDDHEEAALLLIQSYVRRWLVLKKLKQQFGMYYRLAKLDNHEHSHQALSLQRILTRAWEHVHRRENVI